MRVCSANRLSDLNSESAKVQYWPIHYNRDSLGCAVKRQIAGTPSTENFPNLYPHGAVNRKNRVYDLDHVVKKI